MRPSGLKGLPVAGWANQDGFDRRLEWGVAGATLLASAVDVLIVVDVLSFTTCVDVVVSRGSQVYPVASDGGEATTVVRDIGGVLAVGRHAVDADHPFSLSPASLAGMESGVRLVLPSPNGAAICADAGSRDVVLLAACIRNASAVAAYAMTAGATLGVVPAGERWADGTVRVAVEDLVGAGLVLGALGGRPSPEAAVAIAAVEKLDLRRLWDCASARELVAMGFADDLSIAFAKDVSTAAPVFANGAFRSV
jgi:2-phosphosulfolactate phosphatase